MYLSSTTETECMTTDEIRAWGKKRKYSREYVEYWVSHRVCEAGMDAASGPPHHINTRGAHGNLDESWNLLALSPARHSEYHSVGHRIFAQRYPHLEAKIREARERVGKSW